MCSSHLRVPGTVSVSGLGGNPYRDGSYEYYMSEKIRLNDAKGLGPAIKAALEMENYERGWTGRAGLRHSGAAAV